MQQETGQLMATLEHIDGIKTRLQAAKQALHEADNWSLLATDLEEVSNWQLRPTSLVNMSYF